MDDPELPKRRGRPPLPPDRRLVVHVSVRFQVTEFDTMCAAARRDRSSVAELLRKALRRHGKL